MKTEFFASPDVYEATFRETRSRIYSQHTAFGNVRVEQDAKTGARKNITIILNKINTPVDDVVFYLESDPRSEALIAECLAIVKAAEAEFKSGAKVIDITREIGK